MPNSPTRLWIVTDGAAGNENQARALAHYIGMQATHLRVKLPLLARWLAPQFCQVDVNNIDLQDAGNWPTVEPDFLISCGRIGAVAALAWRKKLGAKCKVVHILNPRVNPSRFDVVIAPIHDRLVGENVITTRCALHRVDDQWLSAAREKWSVFAALPEPRTAILLGGNSRHWTMSAQWLIKLFQQIPARGSLLITVSRRTPKKLLETLGQLASAFTHRLWTGAETNGENPYAGILAHAQRIVVSPDSVNMLSESFAVGVPVYTDLATLSHGKIGEFLRAMAADGYVKPSTTLGQWHEATEAKVLRETPTVALQVRKMLGIN
jgi:uncharacterized protein